jgi:AGZA family xanthine/uracil permease-like MFS transporter
MGVLIGVSYRAGFLDEKGNLPEIEKPMLCDSTATIVGALLGTTTTGSYIEAAAGVEAGGRSGFTAVVTAILFLVALFFTPILTVVPPFAYGAALIIVGMLMLRPITELNFDDLTEVFPAFMTIALMSFTYNIGIGMTAGFIFYPITKIVGGKSKDIHPGMWLLFGISILFYIFYPY